MSMSMRPPPTAAHVHVLPPPLFRYILLEGLVLCEGRVHRMGMHFGADMILLNPELRRKYCMRVLSEYVNMVKVHRKSLYGTDVFNFVDLLTFHLHFLCEQGIQP